MAISMVTLEFEFKTSTKVYNYLRRYINAGIKFRNCLCYEFNQTKEIKKVVDITEKYDFKLKQYDLFKEIRNNLFPMGKVKWNKGTKRAYYKYKKEGKEWNNEIAKEYTNLKYKKRYQTNCFTLSHRRIKQEWNIIIFSPAANYVLGTNKIRLNRTPKELKIKLIGYEEKVSQYKGFTPKYYKIKKSLDKMFILITGEYEEFIPRKKYEGEEVIGIDTGLDKDYTHILSNGEKYTTITKNIERNEKKLNNMKSRYDRMYDRKSNTKCIHQLYLEHEMKKLELRLQRQRKARAIYIACKVNRKAKIVIMDDVKASDLFKLSKKNWNKCRGPQNAYLGFTETWIKWITEKNGKKFYKLKREKITASTRVCNCCGAKDAFLKYKEANNIEDPLSIREFTCPYCGRKLDRDVNAARNIRDWGIEDLNKVM